jgi:HSP20 family protein
MSTLLRRDGFFPSPSLIPSFDVLADDFFNREFFNWNDRMLMPYGATLPSVNIEETPAAFQIELAAPGLKRDDFKVELKDNVLTISSEKQESSEEKREEGNYRRREFSYAAFTRSFSLPESANENKIEATYKDGILHLEVAKKHIEAPKATKKIEIK